MKFFDVVGNSEVDGRFLGVMWVILGFFYVYIFFLDVCFVSDVVFCIEEVEGSRVIGFLRVGFGTDVRAVF